jgi:hypothetical protein
VEYGYGTIARAQGRPREARERIMRASALFDAGTFAPQFRAVLRSTLGLIDGELGDLAAARRWHAEALEIAVGSNDAPIVAMVLVGVADLALRGGDPAKAARMLGAAVAVRGSVDRSVPDVDRIEGAARDALGEAGYEHAYRTGDGVTMAAATETAAL